MLKLKAKAMASKDPKVLFDIDTGENTFITGGGLPGKKKFAEEEFKEEKIYQNEEDKLLDDVDNEQTSIVGHQAEILFGVEGEEAPFVQIAESLNYLVLDR